jgi:cell division protein FtsB
MRGIEPVLVAPLRPGKGGAELTQQVRGRMSRAAWLGAGRGRRLAIALFWGGLALAAAVRLGSIAFQPILVGYRSGREIRDLASEYQEARLRNERLHRQIAFLKTSAGVEEEARRLGWVRAGERPLQIVLPETVAHRPSHADDRPPTADRGPLGDRLNGSPHGEASGHSAAVGAAGGPRSAVRSPTPRSSAAERVQQILATWSATKWLGAVLQRKN